MHWRHVPIAAVVAALSVGLIGGATASAQDPTKLTLGSWRTEDLAVWQDTILPAFKAAHPDIKVEFAPINTNEYNAAIQSQVEGGTGPDLITCRPFDVNREWIEPRLLRASSTACRPSRTSTDALGPRGPTQRTSPTACRSPRCSPASTTTRTSSRSSASQVPTTQAEFIAVLQAIKAVRQVRAARLRLRRVVAARLQRPLQHRSRPTGRARRADSA